MIILMQKNSKQFEYRGNYRHSLRGDDFALRPCMMCNSESAIKTFCFIVKFFRLFSYHLKRSILDIDFRMSNPISTRF